MWFVSALAGICLLIVQSYALRDMWGWFIVPLGVPHLGLLQAAGIMNMRSLFSSLYPSDTETMENRLKEQGVREPSSGMATFVMSCSYLVLTVVVWFIGYVIHKL